MDCYRTPLPDMELCIYMTNSMGLIEKNVSDVMSHCTAFNDTPMSRRDRFNI